ncbi:MAG: transposase [Nitrospinae bacterium]|nr:transposase [Nitrospinota bacterium]
MREAVSVLAKKGFITGSKFILDATDLPTTKRFKGCGVKKKVEKKKDKDGKEIEVVEYIYGFKLLVLMEAKSKIIVAAKVVKINEHESQFTMEMIREAQRNIGSNVKIKRLLIDRGFIDGVTLWKLKKEGIHFIIPVRGNMDIAKDIRGFRDEKADGERIFCEESKEVKAVGVKGLLSYDQFGDELHQKKRNRADFKTNPINAVMVIYWDGKEIERGKEKVFITDLPVNEPLNILSDYDLRSTIENQGFRELKQGYYLLSFPQKNKNAVTSHCILTLIIFSFVNAYRTKEGRELAEKGIRRWREKQMGDSIHKMIVYYDGIYGIVDVEELFYIMGMTPKELFRLKPERFKSEIE